MKTLRKYILRMTVMSSAAALAFAGCTQNEMPHLGASSSNDAPQSTHAESSVVSQSAETSAPKPPFEVESDIPSDVTSDTTSDTMSIVDIPSESSEAEESLVPPPAHMLTADLITDPVGSLPQSQAVDESYFDDAVFVGDSISVTLSYYEATYDKLGKAQFLTSSALGSANANWPIGSDSVLPSYQGEKMYLQQSVPLTGAKKLYIMLGMNDISMYGTDGAAKNLTKLIEEILKEVPDMTVFVQSMTPITATSNIYSSGHNPVKIKEYNDTLAAICVEKGWNFINVGSIFADEHGYLKRDYCSDPDGMGIHFKFSGCEKWVDYLYTHTPQQ